MKNFKTIFASVAIALLTILPTSANTEPTSKDAKTILRTEIVSLLGKHKLELASTTLKAQVSVMLNNQNEIVVIGVKADNEDVTDYVKTKLNYKKVSTKGIEKGIVYRIPLKMIQSS